MICPKTELVRISDVDCSLDFSHLLYLLMEIDLFLCFFQLFLNNVAGGASGSADFTREKMRRYYRFHIARKLDQVKWKVERRNLDVRNPESDGWRRVRISDVNHVTSSSEIRTRVNPTLI